MLTKRKIRSRDKSILTKLIVLAMGLLVAPGFLTLWVFGTYANLVFDMFLEPISKLLEENAHGRDLHEAEEIARVVLPAHE